MAKVAIPVSKTNYNRVKAQTHTLEKVLRLEGLEVWDGHVPNPINNEPVRFDQIELYPKKRVIAVSPVEEKPAEAEVAISGE